MLKWLLAALLGGTASLASSAPLTHDGMRLVWSDEFDTDGLPNPKKWSYDTDRNQQGWYNHELQYYASHRPENASVRDGRLTITARREQLNTAPDYGGQQYTSARLVTRGKASWTYGFVEVRAKLPCSLGTWPAIWMLGTKGTWPDDGEIDILEQKGMAVEDKASVMASVHTKAYNHAGGTLGGCATASKALADACSQFHNYQLSWSPELLVLGVDGVSYLTYAKSARAEHDVWPFDDPQYLILNVAVGGQLGGKVPHDFVSDQMVVDYVRVYQK